MEEGKLSKKDIKIVIAAHKPYRMPEDTMYVPLHVGAEGKRKIQMERLLIWGIRRIMKVTIYQRKIHITVN